MEAPNQNDNVPECSIPQNNLARHLLDEALICLESSPHSSLEFLDYLEIYLRLIQNCYPYDVIKRTNLNRRIQYIENLIPPAFLSRIEKIKEEIQKLPRL